MISVLMKGKYVGETKGHIVNRIKDNSNKDNSSHLLKHSCENVYTYAWEKYFQILVAIFN